MFFAGRTVPEEKQKDAGHFDPLCHSNCSNSYSFWNKVLILHSPGVCFLCGCLLCICVDLDSVSVLLKTKMTAFLIPTRRRRGRIPRLFTGALWAMWLILMRETINNAFEPGLFYQVTCTQIAKTLRQRFVKPDYIDICVLTKENTKNGLPMFKCLSRPSSA